MKGINFAPGEFKTCHFAPLYEVGSCGTVRRKDTKEPVKVIKVTKNGRTFPAASIKMNGRSQVRGLAVFIASNLHGRPVRRLAHVDNNVWNVAPDNLMLKEVKRPVPKKGYTKRNNKYIVQKCIQGKCVYFDTCLDEESAREVSSFVNGKLLEGESPKTIKSLIPNYKIDHVLS